MNGEKLTNLVLLVGAVMLTVIAGVMLITRKNKEINSVIAPITVGACKTGGCNGELCGENDIDLVSSCVYSESFACFAKTKCERQADGKCAWNDTPEFQSCLQETTKNKQIMNSDVTPTVPVINAVCGNAVCEEGEANRDCEPCAAGQDCRAWACVVEGSCPSDCGQEKEGNL